jgi:hypothetical protein
MENSFVLFYFLEKKNNGSLSRKRWYYINDIEMLSSSVLRDVIHQIVHDMLKNISFPTMK